MNQNDNIKDTILSQIREGKLHMHSPAYFALRVALLALIVFLALVVSVLIFNFIFFTIRISEEGQLLGFGVRGFLIFLEMFPWTLLAIDIVLVLAAERMLRYFRFGYRNPVVVLIGGLLVLTVLSGLVIDRATPFNDRMLQHARERNLGPLNGLYEGAHRPGPLGGGLCRCVITEVGTSSVVAYDEDASSTPITIILPPGFATSSVFKVGDIIYVAGDRDGDSIDAFGVRRRPPQHEPRGGASVTRPAELNESGTDDTME
ncbi:hypothetical protein K8R03_04995 [Candidatus Kaiserbacteria bacterium]|nr:hypothetical protein [Candidatus Kaiserbacteria bacterium]